MKREGDGEEPKNLEIEMNRQEMVNPHSGQCAGFSKSAFKKSVSEDQRIG